jgi:hypothetical protein
MKLNFVIFIVAAIAASVLCGGDDWWPDLPISSRNPIQGLWSAVFNGNVTELLNIAHEIQQNLANNDTLASSIKEAIIHPEKCET